VLLEYYGLNEQPFGVTPDPRFMYFGSTHREALASLLYGVESNRGFIALIAKPGTGKTSLIYHFLEGVKNKARTAFLFQTDCHRRELLRHILADLGLDATGKDLPAMHEMFNKLLAEEMQAGRRVILVIDEAQNLEEKALESIRLLSNFETPWMKLLQIVLAGQPQLAQRLSKTSLTQLRQRVSLIARIEPFTSKEIGEYIRHRLSVAGYKGPSLFTAAAQGLIASHSEGVPRNINNICFGAMSLACALKKTTIDREIVSEVLADLDLGPLAEETQATAKSQETTECISLTSPQNTGKIAAFRGWLPRLAAACALLFALSWPLNNARTTERPRLTPVPLPGQMPPTAAGAIALDSNEREVASQPKQESVSAQDIPTATGQRRVRAPGTTSTLEGLHSVTVNRGQTLYRIVVSNLGVYNDMVLHQLRALNPWLDDPAQVQAGQVIIIPSARGTSGRKLSVANQDAHRAGTEVEKQ